MQGPRACCSAACICASACLGSQGVRAASRLSPRACSHTRCPLCLLAVLPKSVALPRSEPTGTVGKGTRASQKVCQAHPQCLKDLGGGRLWENGVPHAGCHPHGSSPSVGHVVPVAWSSGACCVTLLLSKWLFSGTLGPPPQSGEPSLLPLG